MSTPDVISVIDIAIAIMTVILFIDLWVKQYIQKIFKNGKKEKFVLFERFYCFFIDHVTQLLILSPKP